MSQLKNMNSTLLSLSLILLVFSVTSLLFNQYFLLINFFINKSFFFLLNFKKETILFFLVVVMISICVFTWARFYMMETLLELFFFFTLFLFVFSMLVLILSESFFLIFLGWEGLGITSFLLIIFYQNWMSAQGGLLTLLTNRIGDAILLISFSYFLLSLNMESLSKNSGFFLFLMMFLLTLTKSAQIPFTSWLPAAMAAPTPVSALVHSSTLVTAGIWLLFRFSQKLILTSSLFSMFGFFTLLMASLAALSEKDGKKIIALSTLSQLGLMVFSLMMGLNFICIFHLIMHAFAKANLFLIFGNLIHNSFSQQDTRYLYMSMTKNSLVLLFLVSVISLSGIFFTSGFFSKDLILLSSYSILNSMMSLFFFISIISLTFSYCFKLFSYFFKKSNFLLFSSTSSFSPSLPSVFLSLFSITMGYYFFLNFFNFFLLKKSFSSLYWMILILFVFFLTLLNLENKNWSLFFFFQLLFSISLSSFLIFLKKKSFKVLGEEIYFLMSLKLMSFESKFFNLIWIVTLIVFFFFVL